MHKKALRWTLLKVGYPLFMLSGIFSKRWKDSLQAYTIKLNNRLVRSERLGAKKMLLLLPHCLQIAECTIRLTHDVYNCERCGKCEIKDLIGIAEECGLSLHVATGGNLARRVVDNVRPEGIVAVACENDLSGGIADTFPVPVIGIPNERPFGPCLNTRVSLEKVKEAILELNRT